MLQFLACSLIQFKVLFGMLPTMVLLSYTHTHTLLSVNREVLEAVSKPMVSACTTKSVFLHLVAAAEFKPPLVFYFAHLGGTVEEMYYRAVRGREKSSMTMKSA